MSPFVFDWVFDHAATNPEAPAVGTPDRWIDYGELASWVHALAADLLGRGVGPGSFVVFALPPGPAAVAAVLAVQALGGCAVELNRELDERSIASILAQTGARHAFIHGRDTAKWAGLVRASEAAPRSGAGLAARAGAADATSLEAENVERPSHLAELHVVFSTHPPPRMEQLLEGISWTWVSEAPPAEGALAAMSGRGASATAPAAEEAGSRKDPARTLRFPQLPVDPAAPALLVFTSGSTGEPRGVIQTHANIHANTTAISAYLELSPADRALSTLPLFYCYGRSILQTHLLVGGSVFFDHRFMYPRVVMEALGEQRCTGFYGVPLTFELLRRQVDIRSLSLSTLRYVAQAGGAMHPDTIRWCRDVFAPAQLFVMYGQTEATARLSYLPPDRAAEKEGSIGKGLANVELRVVDPQGREMAPGEVGELIARGPSISPGYFHAPDESAAVFRDGWLWTGDLGRRDEEGFVFLVGRSKDMLKLGGHRVSAAEIEQALAEHAGVEEAAVVGVPDAAGGEAAIAFVIAAGGGTLDPAELRRFCRQRLPAFKVPREIRFVGALPRTASGKLAKAELRKGLIDDDSFLEGRSLAGPGAEGG